MLQIIGVIDGRVNAFSCAWEIMDESRRCWILLNVRQFVVGGRRFYTGRIHYRRRKEKGWENGTWYECTIECVASVPRSIWECGESCLLGLSDLVTNSGWLFV